MAYCRSCGEKLEMNQNVCPSCGTVQRTTGVQDTGGFGWGLLGFCIPIVGLVLYLVWKDERPITAKAAGTGALVSVGVSVAIYVIYFIIFMAVAATGSY